MSNTMVSWRDYQGIEGFGMTTQEDLDSLNKALTAGQEINPPGVAAAGDGFALRVESLERTLKNTTFREKHIRLWKGVPKLAAYNTVEEYNQIQEYGQGDLAGFITEGGLPVEDDATYERKFSVVKYLGTTRVVTHVMSLVRPAHGNVIAQETVNGTLHLLRQLERSLFFADSNLSSVQFDGYERLMLDDAPADNIIDMRGQPLNEDVLVDAALTISDAPNYGTGTNLYINPKVKSDLVKTFFPKERHDTLTKPKDGMVGLDIAGFTSPAGDAIFESDVFITDGGGPLAAAIGDAALRPDTPTESTGEAAAPDSSSQFAADDAGDYWYKVVAVNKDGQSAPLIITAGALTVVVGDIVTFGVTPAGSNTVEYYKVYRTKKNGASGTERLILRWPNGAGAGEEDITDVNATLPGTTSGFFFQQNLENMSVKQLAPMVKVPLATINTSIRWMQLLYLAPVLYTPGKNVLFRNIGRSPAFVGQP